MYKVGALLQFTCEEMAFKIFSTKESDIKKFKFNYNDHSLSLPLRCLISYTLGTSPKRSLNVF